MLNKDLFNTSSTGICLPSTDDGRLLFLLHYQNHYIIGIFPIYEYHIFYKGTTDIADVKHEKVNISDNEISYLIKEINKVFPLVNEKDIKNSISSTYSGLRPLCIPPNLTSSKGSKARDQGKILITSFYSETKNVSRKHVIYHNPSTDLVSLLGGKWTSYRRMGEDVVSFAVSLLNKRQVESNIMRSSSSEMKLSGAVNFENEGGTNRLYDDEIIFYQSLEKYLVKVYNISSELAKILVFTYGSNSIEVLNLGNQLNLNVPISSNVSVLKSEVIYAIRNEMAVRPNDFLCRRSGIAFLNSKNAEDSIDIVADLFSKELKWSSSKLTKEKQEAKDNIKFLF